MTNPEKSVEEIVEEFDQMLIVHQSNARVIELLDKPNVQIKLPEVREWLTQTLQAERQKREEVVEEIAKALQAKDAELVATNQYDHYNGKGVMYYTADELIALTQTNNQE